MKSGCNKTSKKPLSSLEKVVIVGVDVIVRSARFLVVKVCNYMYYMKFLKMEI